MSISNVLDIEINNILNKNLEIIEDLNKTILVLGGGGIKGFLIMDVKALEELDNFKIY